MIRDCGHSAVPCFGEERRVHTGGQVGSDTGKSLPFVALDFLIPTVRIEALSLLPA